MSPENCLSKKNAIRIPADFEPLAWIQGTLAVLVYYIFVYYIFVYYM
jgi:hypothetical protein